MDFKNLILFYAACVCISIPLSEGTPENSWIMKELSLNDVTPQGLLNLPPSYLVRNDNHLCHYLVTFLKDVPDDQKQHHSKFGISVKSLEMELQQGDSIDIAGLSIAAEGTNHTAENVTWNSNSVKNAEYKPLFKDICINFTGEWTNSHAKLLVTLFYEIDEDEANAEFCPNGMTKCKCSNPDSATVNSSRMCIAEDLLCNGVDNCAIDCKYDETEVASCQKQEASKNSQIMKELSLNDVTPQGLLNLPPSYLVRNDNHLCHYLVTFLKDVPDDQKQHHGKYGISVKALEMELQQEDSIEIIGLSVNGEGTNHTAEKVTWFSSEGENKEYISLFKDICINFKGSWDPKRSRAKLLLTLYFDNDDMLTEVCPDGMTSCECDNNFSRFNSSNRMCISKDLLCNGVENCPGGCRYDESSMAPCKMLVPVTGGEYLQGCISSDFGYLTMMLMTGLLLILIPAVFIITMMYHKKMNMRQGQLVMFDVNNNRGNTSYPHMITMPPAANDVPPRYDDLRQETKVPL